MFLKGFICGWVGMAAIVAVLIWGTTPRHPYAGSADRAGVSASRDC